MNKQPPFQWPPEVWPSEVHSRFETLISEALSIHQFLDELSGPQDWRDNEAVILARGEKLCALTQETTKAILAYKATLYARPPFHSEYLLHLLLTKTEREALIGDLVEEYGEIVHRFGKRYANLWFYKQVAFSIWPFVRRAVTRAAALIWLSRWVS
jgi:hypothetical protein